MKFAFTRERAYHWHRWFAWHPVKIENSRFWVWLSTVERRRNCPSYPYWMYRPCEKKPLIWEDILQ